MFNVIPLVTTKKISMAYTKGNEKGIKKFHYKKSTKHKESQYWRKQGPQKLEDI